MLKIISLLYRIHNFTNAIFKAKSTYRPYILHSNQSQSDKGETNVTIIHVNGNFLVGGTTQLIVDIIERTSDKYTHKVIVPDYPDPLPYQPVSILKFSIWQMTELLNFLKNEKPALVHIQYWIREDDRYSELSLWYGAIFQMCNELNIKIIQNINVPTFPYSKVAIAHNVFVSKYVMDSYNNSTTVSSVIHPGSNFHHFKNEEVNSLPENSIGMVYRLDYDKLNPDSIEVFISAVRKRNDLTCYIIGGGQYLELYKRRAAEEKMTQNFIFTGFISYDSLPEYYKKIGIFVAPVHNESFGQVTPFAMSMGLCVAGYDIGALSEILGNKDTLVNYGNIEGLANVIIDLLGNQKKRIHLGKRNQQRAIEMFSVEGMIKHYEDLYKQECQSKD